MQWLALYFSRQLRMILENSILPMSKRHSIRSIIKHQNFSVSLLATSFAQSYSETDTKSPRCGVHHVNTRPTPGDWFAKNVLHITNKCKHVCIRRTLHYSVHTHVDKFVWDHQRLWSSTVGSSCELCGLLRGSYPHWHILGPGC